MKPVEFQPKQTYLTTKLQRKETKSERRDHTDPRGCDSCGWTECLPVKYFANSNLQESGRLQQQWIGEFGSKWLDVPTSKVIGCLRDWVR